MTSQTHTADDTDDDLTQEEQDILDEQQAERDAEAKAEMDANRLNEGDTFGQVAVSHVGGTTMRYEEAGTFFWSPREQWSVHPRIRGIIDAVSGSFTPRALRSPLWTRESIR